MRIKIKLEYKDSTLIKSITKEGNASYLIKGIDNPNYPCLSEVEVDDPTVFDSNDMDALTKELLRIRNEITEPEDKLHIDDIIKLAETCKRNKDTVLTFCGFSIPVNPPTGRF